MSAWSLSVLLYVGLHQVVSLGQVDSHSCAQERVKPNLRIESDSSFSGLLHDETGAPFVHSKLRLIEADRTLTAETDASGRFGFGHLHAGQYRLLASSSRAFAQPEGLTCEAKEAVCFKVIVLKVNPTDSEYSECPAK